MNLELRSITKSFGGNTLFRNFSYIFPEIGSYILKGDSGTGKTTLLRIIAGLDNDYEGDVIGGGFKNTSFCFQEYRLFPSLSAFSNVLKASFGEVSEENSQKTASLLLKLGFTEESMKLKPAKLSGGMKQRIAFARAVLRNSPILLLDEPTKELDLELSAKMIEIINEEAQKRLVITVTHKNEEWDMLGNNFIII